MQTCEQRDYSRQSDLVPRETLTSTPILVVGVGAVGRNVAMSLASIGAESVLLVDFDDVEPTNVTTQGFLETDIGDAKVAAVRRSMLAIHPEMKVHDRQSRWSRHMMGDYDRFNRGIVISCVDNMVGRRQIHRWSRNAGCRLYLDARLQGEAGQVHAAFDESSHELYLKSLFDDSEAERGRCTAQATFYASTFVANALVGQMVRWLRGDFICPSLQGTLFDWGPTS